MEQQFSKLKAHVERAALKGLRPPPALDWLAWGCPPVALRASSRRLSANARVARCSRRSFTSASTPLARPHARVVRPHRSLSVRRGYFCISPLMSVLT
jgi:hypothetical protein